MNKNLYLPNTLYFKNIKRIGASEIAELIREAIVAGELNYKERLPSERSLSETYNVARGTVREALKQLENEGLVQTRSGSGTYIIKSYKGILDPSITLARPLELIDARFALEPHICRLAVLHARKKDLDAAEISLNNMENFSKTIQDFSKSDEAFHTILAESTNNSLIISMVNQINSVRNQEQWSLMRKLTLNNQTIKIYNNQHREILNSIKSRDPERASSLMKEHIETARLSLTRATAA